MNVPTRARGRFARSVRLDAAKAGDLEGYLPTSRALDVVRRIVRGMTSPEGTRAFSITGPYGSGKSSLAVFLDALASAQTSAAYRRAVHLLAEHDSETATALPEARAAMGIPVTGMARAVVTAPQREPVAVTVLRALQKATTTFRSNQQLRGKVDRALSRAVDEKFATPSYHEIRELIEAIAKKRPLLLVIDEFGKNLEAYSESGAEGDMYLLQELAEWAAAVEDGVPMIVVTIQHLAFEAYAASASTAKRREWAKVQGRFEDIPYVDSASATRNLIAVALDHGDDLEFAFARGQAARAAAGGAQAAGLPEVASTELLDACWPLHPSTLLVLPELCARYGQNERTLFSFLASAEPLSVTTWLERHAPFPGGAALDWVRLDRVYDYFVESAGNFLSASADGSRWNEVSTAIRDAHGLTDAQRRVLKTVGVINLVAAIGMLRASEDLVAFACADGQSGTEDSVAVQARLGELEASGLITFRDYAQEYRIWRGSDFDINAALRVARRNAQGVSLARLLGDIRPLPPVVAARHSTRTGTLRAFGRIYIDADSATLKPPRPASVCDGLLAYRLDDAPVAIDGDNGSPAVIVDAQDLRPVVVAAIEVAALLEVAEDPALPSDDVAARRELAERTAHARLKLDRALTAAFDANATWTWLNPPDGASQKLSRGVATARLSYVLDQAYAQGPDKVAYEAINRAELTSAGARARRLVQEAVVNPTRHRQPELGLEGDGAEVAMYRAVLADSGIHDSPVAGLTVPAAGTGWRAVWDAAVAEMADVASPVTADHLLDVMMAPPYGLREGTASLLLTALLVVESANLAVYEHGTFTPRISAPVVERLVRNPRNFAVKYLGTMRRGRGWAVVMALNDALDKQMLGKRPSELTLLSTVQRLATVYRAIHSTYVAKTRSFHGPDTVADVHAALAVAVRDALTEAREPDVLLFHALPDAVGLPPVQRGPNSLGKEQVALLADRVAAGMRLLADANDRLAFAVFDRITLAAVPRDAADQILDRDARMKGLESAAAAVATVQTVPQGVRSFIQACLMNPSTPTELGTQVATTVTGTSPRDWDDHVTARNLMELEETARAFRRFADLARARASYADGDRAFDAYAVTMTAADGRTVDRTVILAAEERDDVTAVVHSALQRLDHLGRRALDALLAGVAASTVEHDAPGIAGPATNPLGTTGEDAHG